MRDWNGIMGRVDPHERKKTVIEGDLITRDQITSVIQEMTEDQIRDLLGQIRSRYPELIERWRG